MSWRLIGRPKTQRVTKALAKTFVEMAPAPHDRKLSERRLQVYERLLAAGQFRPVTWASAACKEMGEVYRVNGKHTSILLSGFEEIPEFYVTIEEYECDTLEDVAKLYSTFDSAMQQRNANDIYLSFAATASDLADVRTKIITASPGAIAFALNGTNSYHQMTAPEKAEYILEYSSFLKWADSIIGSGISASKSKHFYKQPVIAAMFSTYQKSMKAAHEFWVAVRDETGPSPEAPDRRLARYIMTTGLHRLKWQRTAKVALSNKEVYVKCIHAWNAWRRGETSDLKYFEKAKIPAIL